MFEKEAEEYAKETAIYYESAHGYIPSQFEKYLRKAIEFGYNKAREENKLKWHKIADGDYPSYEEGNNGNNTITVLTNEGDIAYYSYNYYCWIAEPSSVEIDPPIAWCEIPKFTEE